MRDYAAAAVALLSAFIDPYSAGARRRSTFTAKVAQSETSKTFYRLRAEQKRARKSARLEHLVGIGAIGTVIKVEPMAAPTKVRKPRAKKVIGAVVD